MPADIRSFFGGGPPKPSQDAQKKSEPTTKKAAPKKKGRTSRVVEDSEDDDEEDSKSDIQFFLFDDVEADHEQTKESVPQEAATKESQARTYPRTCT